MAEITLRDLKWIPFVRFELDEHKTQFKDNLIMLVFFGVLGGLLLVCAGCAFAGMGAQNIAVGFSITGGVCELGMGFFAVAAFKDWKKLQKDKSELTEDELAEVIEKAVSDQKATLRRVMKQCEKDERRAKNTNAWLALVNRDCRRIDALIHEQRLAVEKCLPEDSDSDTSSCDSSSDEEYTFYSS